MDTATQEDSMTLNTKAWFDSLTAAREAYYKASDELTAWHDAQVKAEYAASRDEDKAAGRDTSGRSVQRRRQLAFDKVNMSDECRARRDAVEAFYEAYKAVQA